MAKSISGYSKNGLPYLRTGNGSRTIVVFDGLDFSHKPPTGIELMMYGYIKQLVTNDYTVYQVRRKPNLPAGYTMTHMADDYAVMIQEEIGGPVDIIGLSTGGSIAFYFAADHPDLVRKLVLASAGCRLNERGKALQRKVAELARAGKCRSASAALAEGLATGFLRLIMKSMMWLFAGMMIPGCKTSDGIIEIEAEDVHDFRDRLAEIKCPTLVIGGEDDFFYGPIAATSEGIPGAKLILYKKVGHGAIMKSSFSKDVLAFLR